eukprot:SAG22_NODE_6995_length_787_cov_1.114826_1_plen_196_part_10
MLSLRTTGAVLVVCCALSAAAALAGGHERGGAGLVDEAMPPVAAKPHPHLCPPKITAAVQQAGLLSVTLFGAKPDDSEPDDHAVRQAINASLKLGCGGIVFFPPGTWLLNSTVEISRVPESNDDIMFQGSAGHNHVQFGMPPQTQITGPKDAPAFLIGGCNSSGAGNVHMRDLTITGGTSAVKISNVEGGVRFTNV